MDFHDLEQNAIGQIQLEAAGTNFLPSIVEVDRPTILQPTYAELADATFGANFIPVVYYSPLIKGRTVTAATGVYEARQSHNGGVCFLDRPGRWAVYSPNTVYRFTMLQIDASSRSVSDFYNGPISGNRVRFDTNQASPTNEDASLAVGNGITLLLPNWYRTGFHVQNVSAAAGSLLRVCWGTSAASATRGIRLTTNASLVLSGTDVSRERVTVFAELGTCEFNVISTYAV